MATKDAIHPVAAGRQCRTESEVFQAAVSLHEIRFPDGGGVPASYGVTESHVVRGNRPIKRRRTEGRSVSCLSLQPQDSAIHTLAVMGEKGGREVEPPLEDGLEGNDAKKGLERFLIPARSSVVESPAMGKPRETDQDVLWAAFTLYNFQFHNYHGGKMASGGSTKGCAVSLDSLAVDAACSLGKRSRKRARHEERAAPAPRHKSPVSAISTMLKAEIEARGGSDIQVVMKKAITTSDINKAQGRFMIAANGSRVLRGFLTREEGDLLDLQRKEMKVSLIEPCLETRELALKRWKVGGSFSYVLTGGWNGVAGNQNNGLIEGVKVQLWSYRSQGRLCFALEKVAEG